MIKTNIAGHPALVEGRGKPLIFLHGFMSSKEAFLRQISFFSRYYECIAVDLVGFGENRDMPYAYSLDDYVNDFIKIKQSTGSERVNVIAHSFGGRVAIKACATTDSISCAVLAGAAGLKPKRSAKYFCKRAAYKLVGRFFSPKARSRLFFSADYNCLSDVGKQSFKKIVNEHLDGILGNIKCPVLAVYGENDDQTPVYMGKRLKSKISQCRLEVLQGAGHFCFIDRPIEFNYIVKEFLLNVNV